jgi:predicted aspartyl protease
MTTFSVRVEIGSVAGERFEQVDALVDTGSTFTAAPREFLERLGVRPSRRECFRLANGGIAENEVGEARIRLSGKEGTTPVVFNEPDEPVQLGAITLEAFLFGVDPIGERLIPVEGLRMAFYSA